MRKTTRLRFRATRPCTSTVVLLTALALKICPPVQSGGFRLGLQLAAFYSGRFLPRVLRWSQTVSLRHKRG